MRVLKSTSYEPLLLQTDFLGEGVISSRTFLLKILHVRAAVCHEFQKSSARVKIVLVFLQMAGEFVHALRKNADLHLRRAGVFLMSCCLLDDSLLLLFR